MDSVTRNVQIPTAIDTAAVSRNWIISFFRLGYVTRFQIDISKQRMFPYARHRIYLHVTNPNLFFCWCKSPTNDTGDDCCYSCKYWQRKHATVQCQNYNNDCCHHGTYHGWIINEYCAKWESLNDRNHDNGYENAARYIVLGRMGSIPTKNVQRYAENIHLERIWEKPEKLLSVRIFWHTWTMIAFHHLFNPYRRQRRTYALYQNKQNPHVWHNNKCVGHFDHHTPCTD